jgi:predicted N-acetyltransferase YhbS
MTLTSPDASKHEAVLAEIFARTFSDYWTRRDYVTDGYIRESTYDWAASRIGIVDDEVVSHFGVWDFGIRIGTEVVRVAGIGAVATLRPHRGQGLMARTAADCVAGLAGAGYDLSLLFGIPNFYHRFGYVVSFSQIMTDLLTRDVKPLEGSISYERFDGSVSELAHLYNSENEGVTGTYVRPTYRLNRRPKQHTIFTFENGYAMCGRQGDTMQVGDCAGDPATILEIARQRAVAEVCPKIEFVFVPPRSRMGEFLQTLTHRRIIHREAAGGPMMKIVNLQSTIEKIAPVLSRRLAQSPMHGYTGLVVLHGDGESAELDVAAGRVKGVSSAPGVARGDATISAGPALVRFLIGDGDPHRICRQSGVRLEGDAEHLMPILFPDQEPSTILWDRF